MRVAVYSGSFNPLHIGHKAIMEFLLSEMDFDSIRLVVSPQNPLKRNIDDVDGRRRFEAAEAAVKRCGLNVVVDDIELNMPAPHYSIRTLDALKEREPGNDFLLVMGADNLACIRRWKDYRRILMEYGIVVYPRKGYDIEGIREDLRREDAGYGICIADAPVVDISSTEIRDGMASGMDMSRYLM